MLSRFRTKPSGSTVALIACILLLVIHATLAWTAVVTKSATADEPLHALAAYMRVAHGDFRLNPEDPPLWGYWAAALQPRRAAPKLDLNSPLWIALPDYMWNQSKWVTQTLYRTPGNDPDRFINLMRARMLVLSVALGALIALWSWQLAGRVAAVIACMLFALDPNFLGHGPLVKDDVPIALLLAGLTYATWRGGEQLTPPRALAVALLLAAGLNVKFSGVLFIPIVAILLFARALFIPRPWIAMGRLLVTRRAKLAAALATLALCGAVSILGIWACYGFRFRPAPDARVGLNLPLIATSVTWTRMVAHDPQQRVPSRAALEDEPTPLVARVALWIDRHELLPRAWVAGFLDTYKTTMLNPTYLLGRYSKTGWWYYFPLAMLFKTPLATLAAVGLALAVRFFRRTEPRGSAAGFGRRWNLTCLTVPLIFYGGVALTSNLNLGLRHVLPLYPFIYLLIASSVARLGRAWRPALVGLGIALAAETLLAFPNYISFFNAVAKPFRLHLLSDSNLDWGQDLKLLARWRAQHPGAKLYLSYFGMADPGYYLGDDYTPLPGTGSTLREIEYPRDRGVLAISATNLQGVYVDDRARRWYRDVMERQKSIDVLGTIYLYDFESPR